MVEKSIATDINQVKITCLDQLNRNYLAILGNYGATFLHVLSSMLSSPTYTIQKVVEPYLIKEGFVIKGKSSLRLLTDKGKKHINNMLSFPSTLEA